MAFGPGGGGGGWQRSLDALGGIGAGGPGMPVGPGMGGPMGGPMAGGPGPGGAGAGMAGLDPGAIDSEGLMQLLAELEAAGVDVQSLIMALMAGDEGGMGGGMPMGGPGGPAGPMGR